MKIIKLLILLLVSCSLSAKAGVVKISGSLKQFGLDRVSMNSDGIAAEVYHDRTIEIILDSNGRFDLKLKLKQPAYYKVGHNTLYLTPGDDLEIIFNRNTTKTTFNGKGIEANNYLRNSAKLSGCEIAKIGRELNEFGLPKEKVSFEVYRYKVDSIVDASLDALAHLTAVTPEFRELEQIRLEACRLATYLDYFSVGQLSNYDDAPEVKLEKKQAFYREVATLAEPLLKKIGASDRYLEISDVRNILRECHETQVFQFALSPAFREWMTVLKNAELLDQGLMLKDYRMYTDFSRQIRNKELRNSFQAKLQERAKLMEGRPAPDIPFKDIDGKEMRLSDFKGKVLYVDFCATWCLPCLFQLPEFEKLSEKYPDIRFIGISIDQNEKLWVKRLKKDGMPAHIQEVLADPYVVGDAWDITSIPRFLLIDENFRIINAFAPRPSDREKIEPLLAR